MKKFVDCICSMALFSALILSGVHGLAKDFEKPNRHLSDIAEHLDVEIPNNLKELISTYKTEQEVLRSELKAEIEALEDSTDEDAVRATVQSFREENADRIDTQKAISAEIRDGIADLRKANGGASHDHPISPEVQSLRDQFRAARRAFREERRKLRESLADATQEERGEIIAQFHEDNQAERAALRELRRELRDTVKDLKNLEGDERPDDE